MHTSKSLLPKSNALEVQMTIEMLLGINHHVLINVGFCCRNLKERDSVENQEVDARLILKCVFKKESGREWTGLL